MRRMGLGWYGVKRMGLAAERNIVGSGMATVFLNGRFVSRDEAAVSAFDAGFQHGVGLFETMLAVRREGGWRVLHVREHLERLSVSARGLGLSEALRVAALEEAVVRTVERARQEIGSARLRVRLTITGGDLNLLGKAKDAGGSPPTPGGPGAP